MSVLLTPHPGNVSLQHRERNTEYLQKNTTNQDAVLWNLIPINTSTKQFPNVRHRIYCGRGSGMFVKGQRNKGFALRFCPPEMSETIFITSHQYGFLNLTWIRMGAIDMSNMGRGSYWGLNLRHRATGNQGILGVESSPRKRTPNVCSIPKIQP